MKPIIGINVDIEDGPPQKASIYANYFNAIQQSGGIPILVPPMPDEDLHVLLTKISGLMLIGGDDYNPSHYQETPVKNSTLVSSLRDEFDLRLLQRAIGNSNLPILCICAGSQALNIALGGSLIQDIPSELTESHVQHASPKGWQVGFNKHNVKLSPGSQLSKIYSAADVAVVTSHHQSIRRLGAGLQATAHADDDVIEAVEYAEKAFVLGVQWHPERDFEGNRQLFETFVKQASGINTATTR